ncbi:metallophosphoesterase domain-containing protein [Apiosordaria backusii]|uniref:Metallophosphoesterase domain-containing protein n=1 Tax=Apiosordaria backusii TaxID=314023 RepID=A0AA39ZPV3_9PEZI|nr:metallophosphoesterase domain-containing protein [Apiosordaria backusii]
MPNGIKTSFLILSDTHAEKGLPIPSVPVDVAIHCGDLTEESKLHEFHTTLELLRRINAPLKLVIPGNHDFTLDKSAFQKKIDEFHRLYPDSSSDASLIKAEYGDFGEARRLFDKSEDIVFLEEGTHTFHLQNGAKLTVYASPFTPSPDADWGFQYKRGEHHQFKITGDVDIVITHGPPNGVLDRTANQRLGCEHLFAAVARARPRMHCFGHVHSGWGAKLVAWRENVPSEVTPTHFSAIDNGGSVPVESLAGILQGKWDTEDVRREKEGRLGGLRRMGYRGMSHCVGDEQPVEKGRNTLFVNAAVKAASEEGMQFPWVVEIDLPVAVMDGLR